MLKVKHERLLFLVVCHSLTRYYALWLQRYNFNFRKKRERGIFLKKSINTQAPPLLLCTKFSDNSQLVYCLLAMFVRKFPTQNNSFTR